MGVGRSKDRIAVLHPSVLPNSAVWGEWQEGGLKGGNVLQINPCYCNTVLFVFPHKMILYLNERSFMVCVYPAFC